MLMKYGKALTAEVCSISATRLRKKTTSVSVSTLVAHCHLSAAIRPDTRGRALIFLQYGLAQYDLSLRANKPTLRLDQLTISCSFFHS